MKSRTTVFLHILLWLALLAYALFTHFGILRNDVPWPWLVLDVVQTFLFHLALFYFNWFVLVPRILAKDRVVAYAAAVLLTLVLYSILRSPLEVWEKKKMASLVPARARELARHPNALEYQYIIIQLAVIGVMNIFLSSSLKVTGDYLRNERRRKELELQQTSSELELLKAQVNPHFLFNTLNNIYSLAYQNAPSTADAILKLSLLLRYQLYETGTALVPLEREVENLEHLLDLHRLRLTNPALLQLTVTGALSGVSVPPMLLMPLVENMFKHGLTSAPMQVTLQLNEGGLHFATKNQVKAANQPPDDFGGIGIQNLRRRLALLYPGTHSFHTALEAEIFTATLTLTKLS